ncbi:MAG: cytochrome C [Gallionellaceae bacterium]|nr:cytochrome C [Gallionellaceae bacterium]
MKKNLLLVAVLFGCGLAVSVFAAEGGAAMDHSMHHQHVMDDRISAGVHPEMKQHQLANMRSHVAAVQSIVGHLAKSEFDQASQEAHSKLGLTDEMKKMCSTMSDNKEFTSLGLAFHKSGDDLGDALQTKDMKKSLQALHDTMDYCVKCHATFRQ